MNRTGKIWLIIAIALLLIGGVIFAVSYSSSGFDLGKLGADKFVTNTYDFEEGFSDISIRTTTAKLIFEPAEDGKCRVVCYEAEKQRHSVSVSNGTLTIDSKDSRKWYEKFGSFSFENAKLTIYLPESSYRSLSIETSTGDVIMPEGFAFDTVTVKGSTSGVTWRSAAGSLDIDVSTGGILLDGISADRIKVKTTTGGITLYSLACTNALELSASTGGILLTDASCGSLTAKTSTGHVRCVRTVSAGALRIETSTGDVKFESCDAAELYVKTSTGDITGTLLTEKVFITDSSTGRINVPDTTAGGRCELRTSTGDIRISLG